MTTRNGRARSRRLIELATNRGQAPHEASAASDAAYERYCEGLDVHDIASAMSGSLIDATGGKLAPGERLRLSKAIYGALRNFNDTSVIALGVSVDACLSFDAWLETQHHADGDDEHVFGEMSGAAAAYVELASRQVGKRP